MAIVSLDAATAGGAVMADTKRTAQKASDRWRGDFMGEKEVSHLRRFQHEAQDDEMRSTCER